MTTNMFKELVKATNDKYTTLLTDGESSAEFTGFIDTGSLMLNAALSADMFGGFPNNKVLAIAGPSTTGKTFFALGIARDFLNKYADAGVINFDTESATTRKMMQERGIDISRVIVSEPNTLQDFRHNAISIIDKYVDMKQGDAQLMMILDSLGNLSSNKELEDSTAGKDTRDMTKAQIIRACFRVLRLKLAKAQIPMIVTNHVYASIGGFIPQSIMSGGDGLKFAADQILFLTKAKERDSKLNVTGNVITVTVVKSRLSRENTKVKVLLDYTTGLNRYYGLLDFGVDKGIIEKAGKTGYKIPGIDKPVTEKNALKNPDKYFSAELLNQLNEAAKVTFSYGDGMDSEYGNDDDDDC